MDILDIPLTPKQTELVRKIAQDEGIARYTVDVSEGSIRGDGYMGIITTVKINDCRSPIVLNLVFKSSKSDEQFRLVAPVRKAYLREIYIYQVIFPEFLKFQIKHRAKKKFNSHARCFRAEDGEFEETIALEDLRTRSFKLWDKLTPMDESHVALVCREFGKFHGISFAMKQLRKEKYELLTKDLNNIFEGADYAASLKKLITELFGKACKIIQREDVRKAVENFGKEAFDFIKDRTNAPTQNSVLLHGDCWCNNLMFKYDDNNSQKTPTQLCIIDWQISKVGNPCLDLAYFLWTSSSKGVLEDYRTYIKIYHDSLIQTINDHNADPGIYPYDVFLSDWKEFAKFGLYMSFIVLEVLLGKVQEETDNNDESSQTKNPTHTERVNYIAEIMFDNGLI